MVVSLMVTAATVGVASAASAAGATISGRAAAFFAEVNLYDAASGSIVQSTTSEHLSGDWSFEGLAPGTYKIGFVPYRDEILNLPPQEPEFWNDAPTLDLAEVITVMGSENITGIDADFAIATPAIEGTLEDALGSSVPWNSTSATNRTAIVYTLDGDVVPGTVARVGMNGIYEVWGLPTGTYKLKIGLSLHPSWSFAWTFAGDTPFFSQAAELDVVAGVTTAGPTITLPRASSIYGTLTDEITGDHVQDVALEAYILNDASGEFELLATGNSGNQYGALVIEGLLPGTYRLRFVPPSASGYAAEWWEDTAYAEFSTTIEVGDQDEYGPVTATIGSPQGFRLAGADRFATNVAVSRSMFPPSGGPYNIDVLYVASGLKFPDALSAGPVAVANNGGLLLVALDAIPDSVRAEIVRLNPSRIVVVGGTASVSANVYTQLGELTDEITRITGADRFEVSRNLLTEEFPCAEDVCMEKLFVATGRDFPDALSAGPAAVEVGGAVLLVNGAESALDDASRDLVNDLGVTDIYIAGGTLSVTAAVAADLAEEVPGDVERLSGPNRYAAAASINSAIFGDTETVFVASGVGFADALAGGTLAGNLNSPLYLAPATCMTANSVVSILERNPVEIVLLGGTASIADSVLYKVC